jgi:hypothetical protein
LDLGAAHARSDGYVGVDRRDGDDVDIIAELPANLIALKDSAPRNGGPILW